MPIKIASARQQLIYACVDIALADLVTGTDQNVFQVPPNAVIAEGAIIVDTVFNSTTSDVISLGDSTTYNRYKSALTIQATGRTVIVPTGFIYTAQSWLTVRWVSGGGTPATGALRIEIGYYARGRSQFNQGPDQGARLT